VTAGGTPPVASICPLSVARLAPMPVAGALATCGGVTVVVLKLNDGDAHEVPAKLAALAV